MAFVLAEMGMFINRGGPVPSVHSFAQSTMGWVFLGFMAFTLIAALAAFMWRIDTLKSKERLDSMLSRESAFLTQNVLFLAVAFITLWGTIYPVFSEAASDEVITVGKPFFDRVNGPILLTLVFLMGVGPLLPWRRANMRNVLTILRIPLAGAAVATVGLVILGLREPLPLLAVAVCVITFVAIAHEWLRGSRVRHRRGESYPLAFARLLGANRPPLRRLRRPPRNRHAGNRRNRLLVLLRAARLQHVPRRHPFTRRLRVHLRRFRLAAVL